MLPQIREINFPEYATLHQATVNLADMGDKVITAQVKIDGAVKPEFVGTDGKDWTIEFRGERYIHPLREPQARKDNSSVCSMIDLTFYHWAIYQMKRYFFVALANVESGTPIVDKYIVPMALDLPNFAKAVADMLAYYFPRGEVYVYKSGDSYINPEFTDYDHQTKYLEIDHTYIWEVLQKTYELYECRWSIVKDEDGNYAVKFGYPLNTESSHIFMYGYDGGLLSLERQVQDDSIRNQLLGRGGSKNLPYMYFKDYERFHPNSENSAYQNIGLPDPDAIPELENILFSELRDTNFRSYVQGWKVNTHRQASTNDGWAVTWNADGTVFTESNGDTYSLDTDRLETDWAYKKGATDTKFDPVEYVKDDESIETYGLLQGGLANDEDVFPTLQGMELELPCSKGAHDDMAAGHDVVTLADEVVDVEEVVTDVIRTGEDGNNDNVIREEVSSPAHTEKPNYNSSYANARLNVVFPAKDGLVCRTNEFTVPEGYFGNILQTPSIGTSSAVQLRLKNYMGGTSTGEFLSSWQKVPFDIEIVSWGVYNAETGVLQQDSTNLPAGSYYVEVKYNRSAKSVTYGTVTHPNGVSEVVQGLSKVKDISAFVAVVNDNYNFDGQIIANTDQQGQPISGSKTIAAGQKDTILLTGGQFHVPEQGALIIDCGVEVSPFEYSVKEKTLKVLNLDTHEYVQTSNIPEGDYELKMEVLVTNTDSQASHEFTAELGPAKLYYNHDYEDWKPTFDIWIKNIFQTDRGDYATDDDYIRAVWLPLITTQEMTVTFSTGNLSSHSDWEFKVLKDGIHYDNSKTLVVKDEEGVEHEVRSEWRITLIKSDAEADSIHKYVPYKDFNAAPYDRFYFTNIYLPWAYVYAAEKLLNANKEAALAESKEVQPTWVVKVDKIRMQGLLREGTPLFWAINPGDKLWVKDDRFTVDTGVQLYVESMSYNWNGDGANLPDLEFVLSDKVTAALTTVERIQGDIKELSSQVKGLSNLERAIRAVGDAIYLRKDGFEDTSYSPTNVAQRISSLNYRAGIVGGIGWTAETDENGKGVLEIDKLRVREEMQVNNLVINQVSSFGGKEILSAASMTVSKVESTEDGFKCYFDTHNGTVGNLFVVDDIAMSQVWDEENQETKFYKRAVVEVGADYVVLSYDDAYGDGSPAVGDVLAQYGNNTDSNRQFVIIRDVIGGGYEQMLSGLEQVNSTGDEYYYAGSAVEGSHFVGLNDDDGNELYDDDGLRLGYLAPEVKPRWFVGNHSGQYAEWLDGVLTVKGKIIVRNGDGSFSDISYLTDALPDGATVISGGVVLSSLIGVLNGSNHLVAALNGSNQRPDFYDDSAGGHGILMIAAGIPTTPGAVAKTDATTRIFEDGTIITNSLIATNATISGEITTSQLHADGSTIGGFKVESTYLQATDGQTGDQKVDSLYLSSSLLLLREILNEPSSSQNGQYEAIIGPSSISSIAGYTGLGLFRAISSSQTPIIGSKAVGIGINVSGFYENVAIECASGQFYGLRPAARLVTTSVKLDPVEDCLVALNNNSAATITLPDTQKKGQFYIIIHRGAAFSLAANGGTIYGPTGSSLNGKLVLFCYEDGYWFSSFQTED